MPCLEPTPGSFPQLDTGPPAASGLCGWVSKGRDGGQTHPHSVSLRGGRQALPRPTPAFPSQVITKDQPHFPLKDHRQSLLPARLPPPASLAPSPHPCTVSSWTELCLLAGHPMTVLNLGRRVGARVIP